MNHGQFKILTSREVPNVPVVTRDHITWPWQISDERRKRVEAECTAERLDVELLDRVLDERTVRANRGEL